MSYSFNCRAATKAEAKSAVTAELDKVVGQVPFHEIARDAVRVAVSSFIDLVRDPRDDEDILVNANGSGYCDAKDADNPANLSLNFNVQFTPKV